MDMLALGGVFLALVLGLIYWITIRRTTQSYNFPPGPRGLPLIGNVLDFSPATAHFTFIKLSKQYGDLFTLNLAGQKAVVLNSSEVLRDAFVSEDTRDAFAGKPSNFYAKYCRGHRQTSFMTYTDVCKMQRQVFLRNLKMYDTGRHCHEGMVSDQLALVVQTLRDKGGDSFDLHGTLVTTLANTILILILGKRFDLDDPMLKTILAFVDINNQMLKGHMLTILTALPFLRHLPFGYGKIFREYNRLNSKFDEYTFDHFKKSYDPSQNRGLIDSLLGLQNDNPWLKDENIKAILSETMSAGLLTSRAALVSFFLIILHRPEVMQKIQKEIDEVVGCERRPTLADKKQMPYTEAAITEAVRYFGGPFGIPHLTMKDVWLRGFFLPKDTFVSLPTQVIVNFWAMRYDEKVWGDPREYRPERFLDQDGYLLPIDSLPRKSFVGFGVGQRACVGETFARSRLFLCITTLLQEFDFRPSKTEPLPSYDPGSFEFGILPEPPPYKARALPRNNI